MSSWYIIYYSGINNFFNLIRITYVVNTTISNILCYKNTRTNQSCKINNFQRFIVPIKFKILNPLPNIITMEIGILKFEWKFISGVPESCCRSIPSKTGTNNRGPRSINVNSCGCVIHKNTGTGLIPVLPVENRPTMHKDRN
ncbi:MAG: hypothetical protein BWY67_01963 [Bacteroidetes bacterium ADurb.Bin397]|nr:MAG: hypothetical protein BWY67_01963 [Bacteroidetes bacterium ADurb.Bin397]